MGQTKKVIAYRMIARGTVEEKIIDLQKTKKDMAESIVSEDQDFMKKLMKEDLEMLFRVKSPFTRAHNPKVMTSLANNRRFLLT